MPQPKKRSLSGTKNAALASHVKAARVRSAAAAGASSSAEPIAEMDAGAGARCTHMPPSHRSRAFAHARKLSHAGGRGSDRVRSAAATGVIVGRADRGDGYGSGCVMHRNAAQPSLACVCSRTQVVSRRRSWFRAAAAAAEANRSCSKGAARPAHGRAMVDVGRVRDVGRGRPRPLSCRARAHCMASRPRGRDDDRRGRDGDPEGAGRVVGMVVDGHPTSIHTIRREIEHRTPPQARSKSGLNGASGASTVPDRPGRAQLVWIELKDLQWTFLLKTFL